MNLLPWVSGSHGKEVTGSRWYFSKLSYGGMKYASAGIKVEAETLEVSQGVVCSLRPLASGVKEGMDLQTIFNFMSSGFSGSCM